MNERKNPPYWLWMIFSCVVILGTITTFRFWGVFFLNSTDSNSVLNNGSSYGVLSAIFSGLAFAAMIITLWIQKNDLREQQIEMELQRIDSGLNSRLQLFINLLSNFPNINKDSIYIDEMLSQYICSRYIDNCEYENSNGLRNEGYYAQWICSIFRNIMDRDINRKENEVFPNIIGDISIGIFSGNGYFCNKYIEANDEEINRLRSMTVDSMIRIMADKLISYKPLLNSYINLFGYISKTNLPKKDKDDNYMYLSEILDLKQKELIWWVAQLFLEKNMKQAYIIARNYSFYNYNKRYTEKYTGMNLWRSFKETMYDWKD